MKKINPVTISIPRGDLADIRMALMAKIDFIKGHIKFMETRYPGTRLTKERAEINQLRRVAFRLRAGGAR